MTRRHGGRLVAGLLLGAAACGWPVVVVAQDRDPSPMFDALVAGYAVAGAVDAGETMWCVSHAANCREANPVLGLMTGGRPVLVAVVRGAAVGATVYGLRKADRKSTRLNSSHIQKSRMPSSA